MNARTKLTALADSFGARTALAKGRDRLVDLLNGDHGGSIARRNQLDDQHLILLLSFGLRPTSNCLDVGAHRGLILEHFPRLAPFGRHIAYEPLPELCAKLAHSSLRSMSDSERCRTMTAKARSSMCSDWRL